MNSRTIIFHSLLSIILISSIGCKPKTELTVISHNVLAYAGHPDSVWITNNDIVVKAVEFYKIHDPDIIVLQEAPVESVVATLAELLNFNYVYFNQGSPGSTQYPYGFPGAILSHFDIHNPRDFNKNNPEKPSYIFQRHLGSATIETPSGPVFVVASHLCANWGGVFREETRMAEVQYVKENVKFCDQCKLNIWASDFNFKPESKPYNEVLAMRFLDSDAPTNDNSTVPVPEGKVKIDHIFYQGEVEVINFEAIQMPYYKDIQKYLSDHHAVKVIFHF